MITAYVLLTVKTGKEYDVVDEIRRRISRNVIKDVSIVYGMFDIVVVVNTNSLSDLEKIVLEINGKPQVIDNPRWLR